MESQLLPEILVDIFLRLPIKTICKLICVCKYWNSLITSYSFVKAHMNQLNQEALLLIQGYSGKPKQEFHILHRDNAVFNEYVKFSCPSKSYFCGYFRAIGCCNGVICLSDDQETYIHHTFLWNPSIRKCVLLPVPRVTFHTHGSYSHAFGFGYDEINDDYKVVRIVHVKSSKLPPEVDVYKLSSGTWHNISHLGLPYKIGQKAPQVYLKGAAHWLAYDKSKTPHFVVAFVMADEVFRYIDAPDGMKFSMRNLLMQPGNYQGSLTLTESVDYWSNETWSVWVMKEYGATESWTKIFSISVNSEFKCLFGERGNGERIYQLENGEVMHSHEWGTTKLGLGRLLDFRETGEILLNVTSKVVISYHPLSGAKKLELHGLKRPYRALFATSYQKSVALLGNKGHEFQDVSDSDEEDTAASGLRDTLSRTERSRERGYVICMVQICLSILLELY